MEEDGDPVCEGVDLVQLGGHDQHGGAGVALGHDPAVDELDRTHVHATGGLGGHEQTERAPELAGDDHLLLVAPGQRGHCRVNRAGADVVLGHLCAGVIRDRSETQGRTPGELPVPVPVEHEVLGHGEGPHETVRGPVLRHEAHAEPEHLPCAEPHELPSLQPR